MGDLPVSNSPAGATDILQPPVRTELLARVLCGKRRDEPQPMISRSAAGPGTERRKKREPSYGEVAPDMELARLWARTTTRVAWRHRRSGRVGAERGNQPRGVKGESHVPEDCAGN
jgi:hypothetical protein